MTLADEPAAPVPGAIPQPLPEYPRAPAVAAAATDETLPLRPGQLSVGWQMVFVAGWIGVIAGFASVWWACRVAGIAPWWLGPETNPRSYAINALPFVPPLIAITVASFRLRITCWVGVIAGLLCSSIALGDREWSGLALVQLALGLAGLTISLACFGGRMRAPKPLTAEGPVTPPATPAPE